MGDEHAAIIEMDEDVFGAAAETRHAPSLDTRPQAQRERRAQIGAVERQARDPAALHAQRQAAPHGLDFRQFGHGSGGAPGVCRAMLQHMAGSETSGEADFGYRRVNAEEKPHLVRQVFDSVADRYDLMNDLMSGGVHRLWKAELIDRLGPRPGQLLLDVAGGTGDIAQRFLDRAGATARVASIDAYTIAFGLRNVTHIAAVLAEARRVLKPGGRFFCLEFSRVEPPLLRPLYDLYSFTVLPGLGRLVAGDREAYQYLVESIRRFPPQRELARMIEDAGLEQVRCRNLTGGIAALHSGWRL